MVENTSPVLEYSMARPFSLPTAGVSPASFVSNALRLRELALQVSAQIPEDLRSMVNLLQLNIASALHIRGAFIPAVSNFSPAGFVEDGGDQSWWPAANATSSIVSAFNIQLCSYRCENSGQLFVHLVPSIGDDVDARKSRSAMRGHTDATALPFPGEDCGFADIAPSPDLVVLVCLRNPDAVSTTVAPLSSIMRKLTNSTITTLQEPLYDFSPQSSFRMASDYANRQKPVLLRDSNDGFIVRFSHSNVTTQAGDNAAHALEDLINAVKNSFEGVTTEPGDLLLVNNRTALHGKSQAQALPDVPRRWLLRTYGMYQACDKFAVENGPQFVLHPADGGPYYRRTG